MKIGILQAGHSADAIRPTLGDYDDMFHALLSGHGFTFQTWNVVDMEFPASPADADGWLITGSRHGVYEDLPFIAPLERLIREIDTDGRPMIGVCFGHQIIAQALGGSVVKFAGGWSVGRTAYRDAEGSFTVNAWHQDQVVERPARAEVLASSEFCENAILRYGDTIWTIQAHPEFSAEVVRGLVEHRGKGVVPDALLQSALAASTEGTDRLRIGTHMAEFFLRAAREAAA